MSADAFESFFEQCLRNTSTHVRRGAVIFTCMDWRQVNWVVNVGETLTFYLINIVVWNKPSAGIGKHLPQPA